MSGVVTLALVLGGGLFQAANRHVDQGNRLFAEGKLDEALKAYDRAAGELREEPGVRFNRGAALFGLGRFDEAQKEFLRATEARDPKVKESAFYNMGNSFFRLERYKEAVEAYKRALGTDPHDVRAKWNLELALRRLKEEEQKKQGRNDKDQKNDQKDQGQKDSPSAEQKPPPPDKEPQKRPPEVPPPKDAKNDKSPSPNERAQAPQEKPVDKQDAEAVLDALERGEKNLELQQAQLRARGRRRPEKDY